MKQKAIMVIALLALVSLMIIPASAETLTGTLGGGTLYNQTLFSISQISVGHPPLHIIASDIENSGNMYSMIYWPNHIIDTDVGAPDTVNVPFTAYLLTTYQGVHVDENPVGSGTIGYQKIYNTATPPVEQTTGYLWLVFASWNISGRSGDVYLDINMSSPYDLYNYISPFSGGAPSVPSGAISIGIAGPAVGDYSNLKTITAQGDYSATKPSGLNIAGYVNKTGNSRIFIQNISGYTVASDNLANDNDFTFSVYPDQIYIKLLSPSGTWFNSSLLFAAAVPTVTPTPVPTIPPGYIRTEIATIDVYGARISGTNINILDNEAGVWTNSTNDADGLSSVITLPYHTLNVYGSYTQVANEYANNSLIGINTGFDGGIRFYLILYPYYADTGVGNTRVYITVMESAGLAPISNALVKVGILNNATQVGYTSSGGVQAFTVPNQTVLHITAEKPGYITNGIVINSGTGTTAFANIVLDRRTVTPTVTGTILPGETTVRPTQDENDPALHGGDTSFKAQEMMNWLAMNGMMLVQFCFLVTIMALLGVKLGK